MSIAIERRFVAVDGRHVHYRRAGAGPAVVLLHQTPQSSATMEALMRLIAPHATAIALDTPGFGLSDPLPGERWDVPDLAAALARTLDALGLGRVALAGQHTGATIAAEFALRWPERVSALALDGYTAFSPQESETILPHQVPPFRAAWDGSHLAWAWARFRDGWMFFPWSVRSLATRRDLDLPDPAFIQSYQVMELLRSREAYRAVYPGVFAWDGVAAAQRFAVPTLLACTGDDQLYPHLDRLQGVAPGVQLLRLPSGARADLRAAQAAFVLARLPAEAAPAAPEAGPNAAGVRRDYARLADGRHLAFRQHGAAVRRVMLHGAGAAGEVDGPPAPGEARFDLPGHGDSDAPMGWSAAAMAQDLAAALGALRGVTVAGAGLGAAVAVELAHAAPQLVGALELSEVALFSADECADLRANYAPAITPRWDGTHLLSLWHQLRDREFFWPWYARQRTSARKVEPQVTAERIDALLFAALRCADWPAAHAAWFDWRAEERLRALSCKVAFSATPGDCWARDLARLRALVQPAG